MHQFFSTFLLVSIPERTNQMILSEAEVPDFHYYALW